MINFLTPLEIELLTILSFYFLKNKLFGLLLMTALLDVTQRT